MMPDFQTFLLFLAAALLVAITPGPGIFYVAARTLAGGRAEGVASSCGNGLGGMVHVLAGSLGVSTIVLASAELFTALKLIGAAYLVWVGIRTFRSARRDALTILSGRSAAPPVGSRRAFREGVLVEALNPKTAAFFLAFIPQFWTRSEAASHYNSWCSDSCRLCSTPSSTFWSPLRRPASEAQRLVPR
jgi:threonine/homoserine/homoserine lactone efflux protein